MVILSFVSPSVTLATSGGKGANLGRLTRAGFDVPPGFIISTQAYRAFVQANELRPLINSALQGLSPADAPALDAASARIRAAFTQGTIPPAIEAEVRAALGAEARPGSRAVRSSATAEDLPELSFAGQQDTFLNVLGQEQVLNAMVACWSSLWTARAIGYRLRNHIPDDDAALAVVVQEMVPSEISGVLFTANPLTGLRSETVIDATFGLGEALVSGQVEPDHYVVDALSGALVSSRIGAKKISIRAKPGGGVEALDTETAGAQTLDARQLALLVQNGLAIQKEYGAPQDIEWAFVGGRLTILQSRAITSLYPVPEISLDPLKIWFSFGAVQGLLGPLTPLGQDCILHLVLGAGGMFNMRLQYDQIDLFKSAGERLWIRIDDLLRHPLGVRVYRVAMPMLEPSIGEILGQLEKEPRLGAGQGRFSFETARRLAGFALPILARFARNLLRPQDARARFDRDINDYLAAARLGPAGERHARLAEIVAFIRLHVGRAFGFLLPRFIPILGPAMGGLTLLTKLSGDPGLALEVTRGLPRNVTTEMDLALWRTAAAIRADLAAWDFFRETPAAALGQLYLDGSLPAAAQNAIAAFLTQYGMRGVAELDFGQRRWREEPTPLMHTLQSYLQIAPAAAPDLLFARGEQAAMQAIEKIAAQVHSGPFGWLREKLVRAAALRIRLLMGARESPKFFAIRVMGVARQALLEVGREFVADGTIDHADDLVFLRLDELDQLARQEQQDWKALVAARRETVQRELRRRQVPRVLVSDGRAFYEGLGSLSASGEAITGSPVSPGVVEGLVHVVLDPRGTQLAPGEIMVCPGTDPAWTPLFMTAGGLITEVGGMMTHGSVVAREYGIPAVVGVHQATLRLKDGQRVRVDGTRGVIVVLE